MAKNDNNRGNGTNDDDLVWAISNCQRVKQILIWLKNIVLDSNGVKWDKDLSGDISGMNNPSNCFNIDMIV